MFVEVIVDVNSNNVDQTYYYKLPEEYYTKNLLGYRVDVPFANRIVQGYVVNLSNKINFAENKCKSIKKVKDDFPVLTKELILLSEVLADELYCRRIQIIEAMLPTILKNKYIEYYKFNKEFNTLFDYKKFFEKDELIERRKLESHISSDELKYLLNKKAIKLISIAKDQNKVNNVEYIVLDKIDTDYKLTTKQKKLINYLVDYGEIKSSDIKLKLDIGKSVVNKLKEKNFLKIIYKSIEIENNKTIYNNNKFLNDYQKKVYDQLIKNFDNNIFEEFLLHGVTGSGKTEIYIHLAKKYIDSDKEVIILVPEIILTPQMEIRFKDVFGENIALLHSRLSKSEKYKEWKKIVDGKVKICVGTRSSIFAPFKNIGLIIIDEEHESTYKQVETPRYDAKDIAKKRAIFNKAKLIYASATPTVDLYYKFLNNNINNLLVLNKRHNNELPKINVYPIKDKEQIITNELRESIIEKLEKKEQIILFINKRGYTNFIRCFNCNYLYKCENCDVSLNYHKNDNSLCCHFCGYKKSIKNISKCCNTPELVSGVYGIQKIEEYLVGEFPNIKITRMDFDTTRKKGAYEKLITEFRTGKSQILLGTQMISKGLDFPNVTLVGILSVDSMLGIPSFKSNEKLFQLLVQTSGRAGRSDKSGNVIIQSNINSKVINYAIENDYLGFYNYEINRRSLVNYPPFCNISFINIRGFNEEKTYLAAISIANFIKKNYNKDSVLGPNRSLFYKINNEYTYNILIRYIEKDYNKLHKLLKYINKYFINFYEKDKLSISIDNKPQDYI